MLYGQNWKTMLRNAAWLTLFTYGLGTVRTNSLINLFLSGALLLRHKTFVRLIITKRRDSEAVEIPAGNSSRSV